MRRTAAASRASSNGLNRILDLAVPKHEQEGGTYVIPGHGSVCDESDVLEYRDMVTIIRDRIQDMVKRGMTLEQVKAAKPTLDYDLHYGADTGPWTTAMFIEAVYRDVSKAAAQTGRCRREERSAQRGRNESHGLRRRRSRHSFVSLGVASTAACPLRFAAAQRPRSGRPKAAARVRSAPAIGCRSSPKTGASAW